MPPPRSLRQLAGYKPLDSYSALWAPDVSASLSAVAKGLGGGLLTLPDTVFLQSKGASCSPPHQPVGCQPPTFPLQQTPTNLRPGLLPPLFPWAVRRLNPLPRGVPEERPCCQGLPKMSWMLHWNGSPLSLTARTGLCIVSS